MKYKIGDRVKIKTWKEMKEEWHLDEYGDISFLSFASPFAIDMEKEINKKFPDRILTISKIYLDVRYAMKELEDWNWHDKMIEGLIEKHQEPIPIPIYTRWEILDL